MASYLRFFYNLFMFFYAVSTRVVIGQSIESTVCSGIEVVITGLTRNQFGSNPTRVRIPPAAPEKEVKKDFW